MELLPFWKIVQESSRKLGQKDIYSQDCSEQTETSERSERTERVEVVCSKCSPDCSECSRKRLPNFQTVQGYRISKEEIYNDLLNQYGSPNLNQLVAHFLGISLLHITIEHIFQSIQLVLEKIIQYPNYSRKRVIYRFSSSKQWQVDLNRPKIVLTSQNLLDQGLISPTDLQKCLSPEISSFTLTLIPVIYLIRSSQKPQIGLRDYLNLHHEEEEEICCQINDWIEYRPQNIIDRNCENSEIILAVQPAPSEISSAGFTHQPIEIRGINNSEKTQQINPLIGDSLEVSDNLITIPKVIKEFNLPASCKLCWVGDFDLDAYLFEVGPIGPTNQINIHEFLPCVLEIFSKLPLPQ